MDFSSNPSKPPIYVPSNTPQFCPPQEKKFPTGISKSETEQHRMKK